MGLVVSSASACPAPDGLLSLNNLPLLPSSVRILDLDLGLVFLYLGSVVAEGNTVESESPWIPVPSVCLRSAGEQHCPWTVAWMPLPISPAFSRCQKAVVQCHLGEGELILLWTVDTQVSVADVDYGLVSA